MTSGVLFFDAAACGYLAAALGFLFSLVLSRSGLERLGRLALVLSFLAHTAGLIARGATLGALPVTTTYESLLFYGWVFAFGYLVLFLFSGTAVAWRRAVGAIVSLAVVVAMALASSPLRAPDIQPLAPVLRSHWLALHVGFTFAGEGFFAVAFAASLLFLVAGRKRARSEARLEQLDLLSYRAVAIGFPLFTLGGLFFGAIWAKHAWGRYWGWDPKETFMLVTWLVYVAYLHLRSRRNWRGRRAAWVAVLGFLLALFTFAGVNFLLQGLHSYV